MPKPTRSRPEVVLCTFRVRKGKAGRFLRLLAREWPTLRRLRLVTGERPRTYRGRDESGGTVIVDIFTWKDASAADRAHEIPEVMRIWEAMQPLVEARAGRPGWEFPHFQPVTLRRGRG
jgi:hypothetical protein